MRWDRRLLLVLLLLVTPGVAICFSGRDELTAQERRLVGTWRLVKTGDTSEIGLKVVFGENRQSRVEILNMCSKARHTHFASSTWRIDGEVFVWMRSGPPPVDRKSLLYPLEVLLTLRNPKTRYRGDLGTLEFISQDRIRVNHSAWMRHDAEYERVTDPSEVLLPSVQMAGT